MTLPLLNPDNLAEVWNVAPQRARTLLEYYLEDLPQQMTQISTAMQTHEHARVGNVAHSLKSSSRQLGALQLGEAAFKVEQAARTPELNNQLPELVQQLDKLVPPTVAAIHTFIQER